MDKAEGEVRALMRSTQLKYFPELDDLVFLIEKRADIDGMMMRAIFGVPTKVILYYSNGRILDCRYRMGLVPVIAHELAHFLDPVNPERILAERLPEPMVRLWAELRETGVAACSMDRPEHAGDEKERQGDAD